MDYNVLGNIVVVAAVILDKNNNILLSRRKAGKPYANMWEFPGGKVEAGETLCQALARELYEELDILIPIEENMPTYSQIEHKQLNSRSMTLHVFLCREFSGKPIAKEGQAIAIFHLNDLVKLDMPPADTSIVKKILKDFA